MLTQSAEAHIDILFERLRSEVPQVDGLAVVSSDGRIIRHDWRNAVDAATPDKLAAIASALLGLGRKTIEILSTGNFLQVMLQSTDGVISVYSAGAKAVLIVQMEQSGSLGMLNLRARQAATDLETLFASPA